MIRIIGLSSFVRTKVVLSIMAIALLSIGCDDTTDTLGSSLTNSVDKFDTKTIVYPHLFTAIFIFNFIHRLFSGYYIQLLIN